MPRNGQAEAMVPNSQVHTAPSRARGKPVHARGKPDPRSQVLEPGQSAPVRLSNMIALPAGLRVRKYLDTRGRSRKNATASRERQGDDHSLFSAHHQRQVGSRSGATPMYATPWSTAAVIATTSRIRSVTVPPPDRGIDYHSCGRGKIIKGEFNDRIVVRRLLSRGEGVGGVGARYEYTDPAGRTKSRRSNILCAT